jgi:hypothetical protein
VAAKTDHPDAPKKSAKSFFPSRKSFSLKGKRKFRSADAIVRRAIAFAGAQEGNPGARKGNPARERFFPEQEIFFPEGEKDVPLSRCHRPAGNYFCRCTKKEIPEHERGGE